MLKIEEILNHAPERTNAYSVTSQEYVNRSFGRIRVWRNGKWVKLSHTEAIVYGDNELVNLRHLKKYALVESLGGVGEAISILLDNIHLKDLKFWDTERKVHTREKNDHTVYLPDLRSALIDLGKI